MLLIPTKYWTVTCNLTVTSPKGNLATGNLATDLVTSPQKAEYPRHNFAIPVVSAFINVFSKGNLYLERGVDVYIDLDYMCHVNQKQKKF